MIAVKWPSLNLTMTGSVNINSKKDWIWNDFWSWPNHDRTVTWPIVWIELKKSDPWWRAVLTMHLNDYSAAFVVRASFVYKTEGSLKEMLHSFNRCSFFSYAKIVCVRKCHFWKRSCGERNIFWRLVRDGNDNVQKKVANCETGRFNRSNYATSGDVGNSTDTCGVFNAEQRKTEFAAARRQAVHAGKDFAAKSFRKKCINSRNRDSDL